MQNNRVIVVEGKQDKLQLQPILLEPTIIVCTNGTSSSNRLEELLEPYETLEIYVFFDADEAGNKQRKLLKKSYPEVNHLYTLERFNEVERTPRIHLAEILQQAGFKVDSGFLLDKG